MKIKHHLLRSFVWQPFTHGFMRAPSSFFDKNEGQQLMNYVNKALNYIPSVGRASSMAVRAMIANHEAARHAAR